MEEEYITGAGGKEELLVRVAKGEGKEEKPMTSFHLHSFASQPVLCAAVIEGGWADTSSFQGDKPRK